MGERDRRGPATRIEVRGWRIAGLILCTIGACLSADLLRLHVNVHTDPDYQSYCAMSERVNCETVAASDYAVAAGLPVALWGLLFYLALGGLVVWGLCPALRVPSWPFGLLFSTAALASLASIVLFALSHFVIESVCIVCAGTYLVNFALLACAACELRRVGRSPVEALREEGRSIASRPAALLLYTSVFIAAVAVGWLWLPAYWRIDASTGPGGLSVGTTAEGSWWIGARAPDVEIVEYSDYQCPHCLRGHEEARRLVESEPARVRLVHRSFPLDHACNPVVREPFHTEACHYARIAHCAGEAGRFWEANDYLFLNGRRRERVTAAEVAQALGVDPGALQRCVEGEESRRGVERDITEGRARGIRGTPTYVLGDRLHPGRIPHDDVVEALGARR